MLKDNAYLQQANVTSPDQLDVAGNCVPAITQTLVDTDGDKTPDNLDECLKIQQQQKPLANQ